MTIKVERRLKNIATIVPIIVLVVGVFVQSVRTVDLLKSTAITVTANSFKISEVEKESKAQDQSIRNEIIIANDMTKSQLSEIQLNLAVANNNLTYLVKKYDADNFKEYTR